MIAAMVGFDAVGQRRANERVLTAILGAHMPGERGRCEHDPASWGGPFAPPFSFRGARADATSVPSDSHRAEEIPPSPPPILFPRPPPGGPPPPRPPIAFAFDEKLESHNPAAPHVSPALRAAMDDTGVAVASISFWRADVDILMRTPWGTGSCAYVLARAPGWERGALLPEARKWILPIIAVLAAVLLALGPIVRRIRALTEAVHRSASSSYTRDVALAGNDEIGDLAVAFDRAGREIRAQLEERERRERSLRDFLANTTHDVMTPLTVLQGHLAALCEGSAGGPSAASAAMDEAHYIASLVHNLAAVARLEGAEVQVELARVDLGALVNRVVSRHRPIARQHEISLNDAIPRDAVFAVADLTLLEQAVSNVTYNAVRYNRPGGWVAVILEMDAPNRFALRIVDDGPGIAPPELAKLARRGARGNAARTRAPEGQGLGLHIAQWAADLHGFQLIFSRSEGGGLLEVKLEGTRSELAV
jgi:signal transduction histidine kinase